jgi:uncharacterized protein GlcG (DUF336 family)
VAPPPQPQPQQNATWRAGYASADASRASRPAAKTKPRHWDLEGQRELEQADSGLTSRAWATARDTRPVNRARVPPRILAKASALVSSSRIPGVRDTRDVSAAGPFFIILSSTLFLAEHTVGSGGRTRPDPHGRRRARGADDAATPRLADDTLRGSRGRSHRQHPRRLHAARRHERTPDIAVSSPRTARMSRQRPGAALVAHGAASSAHPLPSGIKNTPNAALYGVENINRGCRVDVQGDAVFNAPFRGRSRSPGVFGDGAGGTPLPCEPSDTRGCARGGPMLDEDGAALPSVGITTGKADLFDTGQDRLNAVPVNPGGIPIFRGGKVVGGVGVAGVAPDFAEYAATLAAAGAGRGLDFSEPLGTPGAVFIDGLRLPFFGTCANITCIRKALKTQPPGSSPGSLSSGTFLIQPRDGLQAPENYVLGPRGSSVPGGLTAEEVRRIIEESVAVASRTRAMIRLPINQPTRMTIGISDETGAILALYRMPDGAMFSSDVAMTKARNAYYFSTREGYEVLRDTARGAREPRDRYTWEPEPPPGRGWALTARTISFAGQPLFPPGIDLEDQLERNGAERQRGPWFDLYVYDSKNACTEGPAASAAATAAFLNQSGIVWFPGSAADSIAATGWMRRPRRERRRLSSRTTTCRSSAATGFPSAGRVARTTTAS